ncbi:MAG: hypothetical protein V1850_05580 [Candidatus Bathyarchaeota archaeon]
MNELKGLKMASILKDSYTKKILLVLSLLFAVVFLSWSAIRFWLMTLPLDNMRI